MSPEQDGERRLASVAEAAQAELGRRQEQLSAATEAAEAESTTYEAAGGEIRVTVSGRLRIEELYVSERALRSEDVEPRLLQAINEALAAATSAQAERLSAGLDLSTANMVAAAGEMAAALRDGSAQDLLRPGGADR